MRNDRYFCTWPECGRSYAKPSKLSEHYRSHTNDRCFVCELEGCGKNFLRKGHLLRHQSTAHLKTRPFVCSFEGCKAAFALKHHLTRHEKLHQDPKSFACNWPHCVESFAKHEQLRAHRCLAHTGQALYECKGCDLEFNNKVEFRRHEKVVHSGRVYVCGITGCEEAFTKWSLVVKHRKSEHRKRTTEINCLNSNLILGEDQDEQLNLFVCEECGKGPFKSEASYKQHIRTHTRSAIIEGPLHVCLRCDKAFKTKSGLKAHETAVHSTISPFVCDLCGKGYGYKKLLKRHVERIHLIESSAVNDSTDRFDSDVDVSKISKEEILGAKYLKERSLSCQIKDCRRRFFRRYDLDRHLLSVHGNELECVQTEK